MENAIRNCRMQTFFQLFFLLARYFVSTNNGQRLRGGQETSGGGATGGGRVGEDGRVAIRARLFGAINQKGATHSSTFPGRVFVDYF